MEEEECTDLSLVAIRLWSDVRLFLSFLVIVIIIVVLSFCLLPWIGSTTSRW